MTYGFTSKSSTLCLSVLSEGVLAVRLAIEGAGVAVLGVADGAIAIVKRSVQGSASAMSSASM